MAYKEVSVFQVVRSTETLDPANYILANPDVQAAGLDPVEHFVNYGQAEGRTQIDFAMIDATRATKLAGVTFNRAPVRDRPLSEMQLYVGDTAATPDPTVAGSAVPPLDYSEEIESILQFNRAAKFLDVGAGLRNTYFSNVINVDIEPFATTDVCCDAQSLPFADGQFDHVFCMAVLHLIPEPWRAIDEMLRVLSPGGTIRVDWPFLQPVHGKTGHYFNAAPQAVVEQFHASCDILSSEVQLWQHPAFSLALIMKEWCRALPDDLKAAFEAMTVSDFVNSDIEQVVRLPVCSALPATAQQAIASGSTLVARKHPARTAPSETRDA